MDAEFSPPYGDGTLFVLFTFTACEFSPPYGDGTTTPKYPVMDDAFPSPCGDKLKYCPYCMKTAEQVVSVPLRG